MKTYNYFYYGKAITKKDFLNNVPNDWKSDLDEYGEFNYGGYKAIER